MIGREKGLVSLDYFEHGAILFADGSYRWIDLKRFRLGRLSNPADALPALIADRHYRDVYMTVDSHERDSQTLHGPYRLEGITPACFDPISPCSAAKVVEEFCGLYGCPPTDQVRRAINTRLMSAVCDGESFQLRRLPKAVHEFGWVLHEFRELVVISRGRAELVLAVMAVD